MTHDCSRSNASTDPAVLLDLDASCASTNTSAPWASLHALHPAFVPADGLDRLTVVSMLASCSGVAVRFNATGLGSRRPVLVGARPLPLPLYISPETLPSVSLEVYFRRVALRPGPNTLMGTDNGGLDRAISIGDARFCGLARNCIAAGVGRVYASTVPLVDGEWVHLVVVFDAFSQTATLHRNGGAAGGGGPVSVSQTVAAANEWAASGAALGLQLGGHALLPDSDVAADLALLRVYARALAPSEALALYQGFIQRCPGICVFASCLCFFASLLFVPLSRSLMLGARVIASDGGS